MNEKIKKLSQNGTLNPRPNKVTDIQFKTNDFFDARDLMQVKYEMLRRVHHESGSVVQATRKFGLSRPVFYQVEKAFKQNGVSGLLPKKRGPKQPYKLSKKIIAFIYKQQAMETSLSATALVKKVKGQFGVNVHKRTIERTLANSQKKL